MMLERRVGYVEIAVRHHKRGEELLSVKMCEIAALMVIVERMMTGYT